MKFMAIYTIDIPAEDYIKRYLPPNRAAWEMTEGDSEYEFSYLGETWENGKHRKFVRWDMTEKEFDTFVADCGLVADKTPTCGSLTDRGWFPAICFNGEDSHAILNAYVTPFPENDEELKPFMMDEIIERYKYGA